MLWHALAVSVTLSVVTLTKVYAVISPELPFFSVLVPVTFLQFTLGFAFIYGALILTRALPFEGWTHAALMGVGCILAAFIADLPIWTPSSYPWDAPLRWHIVESAEAWDADGWWVMLSTSLLAVVFYAASDHEARVARASYNAELERAVVQRKVVESRLAVMQARVEPEFLFAALADARRLYQSAPPAADKLLDDLIVYLRAALPQMRGESSTIGREIDLCAAYLAVAPSAREGRMTLATSVDATVRDVPLPPMVLLPLAQAMANPGEGVVRLEAERRDDVALIVLTTIVIERPAGWSEQVLMASRETLAHFYGGSASIEAVRHGKAWVAEIRIPHNDAEAA